MPSPAEAALAFARDRAGEKPEPHRFDLPGIRLSAHVLSPGYERALNTSLINDSRYAAGPQAHRLRTRLERGDAVVADPDAGE